MQELLPTISGLGIEPGRQPTGFVEYGAARGPLAAVGAAAKNCRCSAGSSRDQLGRILLVAQRANRALSGDSKTDQFALFWPEMPVFRLKARPPRATSSRPSAGGHIKDKAPASRDDAITLR